MNTEPTLYLEVSYADNQIKIGIQRPQDMVWHYDTIPVTISELDDCIQRLTENINQMNRTDGQTHRANEKIKSLGQRLCDTLLSSDIKNILRKSTADYLILKLDDALVSIPWELICIDDILLCERYCMGRIVKTHQSVAMSESRDLGLPLSMWILSGDHPDLSGVDQEIQTLLCNLDQLNQRETLVNAAFDQGNSLDQVRSQIRNFDMVHFAGHADYDLKKPEQSGWRIASEHLSAKDIDQMSGSAPMPAFIFSNACQSARTSQWTFENSDHSLDLANAFMRAGVRHYLGTFWEVPDHSSSAFALHFYDALFAGQSVGMALKEARNKCMASDGSPIGAAYVLYGNPTQTYVDMSKVGQNVQTRGTGFHPFRSITQRIQSIPISGVWLLLCATILILGFWMGQQTFTRIDQYQQLKLQAMQKERADKKRLYIDQLFSEIEELTGKSPFPPSQTKEQDQWTSKRLTISMDYHSHHMHVDQSQMPLIAAVLGKSLIENHRATVLERVHLDKILQELKHANSGLVDTENRILPDLLPSQLVLFFEIFKEKSQATILMHLADIEEGRVIDYFFIPLRKTGILSQQQQLSQPLIEALQHHYPIRGRIQDIKGKTVSLNIGTELGIHKKQVFLVLKNNSQLIVDTCVENSCTAVLTDSQMSLQRGWKVEAVNHQQTY